VVDPVIVLVAPPAQGGAALRERLISLGFRCEFIDATGVSQGWSGAEGDLMLVLEPGGYSSLTPMVLGQRRGTRLAEVPLVVLGGVPVLTEAESAEIDEAIPTGIGDRALAERLRVWGRWGRLAARTREAEGRIRDSESADPLTGLPGHRAILERLETEVKRSERYNSPFGLLLGDIEGMRMRNEQFGHRTGDSVIRDVGETLRRAIREVDFVGRYEGDRFAILLPESTREATTKASMRLGGLIASLLFRGESGGRAPAPLIKVTMIFGQTGSGNPSAKGAAGVLAAAEADLARLRAGRNSTAVAT